jgi:pimeloyl-[acyl-carrier protein] methyl ester esterase
MKAMNEGQAKPHLVLLHGWGMHSGLFQPWAQALEAAWQVHAVDLPGHGGHRHLPLADSIEAAAEQVHQLTEHLPEATWLGWSLGGLLALQLARQRPERVKQLVMLCASPCFVQRPHWPDGVDVRIFEQFGNDLQRDVHKTLQRFLALEVLGCKNEKALLAELKTLAGHSPEPDAASLQAGLTLLQETDLSEALGCLSVPSLWLAGRRDRLVAPAAMQRAAALAGQARANQPAAIYHLIRGAGHAPFLTHGRELSDCLQAFGRAHPSGSFNPGPLEPL